MLIIATKSPFTKALPEAANNASVILTQDAVIAVSTSAVKPDHFVRIYALESDLIARGLLDKAQSNPQIHIVNLAQFVELTTTHHPIMNW